MKCKNPQCDHQALRPSLSKSGLCYECHTTTSPTPLTMPYGTYERDVLVAVDSTHGPYQHIMDENAALRRVLLEAQALLEAERQQTEKARKTLGLDVAWQQRALVAEAEIAALKGEQTPFGYVEHQAAVKVVKGETRFAALTMEPKGDKCLPLFTTPQKPVVLPKSFVMANLGQNVRVKCYSAQSVIAAIEAAGGKVAE